MSAPKQVPAGPSPSAALPEGREGREAPFGSLAALKRDLEKTPK